ncbi:hypothetical protein BH18ACI4_BH18ACI4_26800 [soil metagenome]
MGDRGWINPKPPREGCKHSIFVCSPYLNASAFRWLLGQINKSGAYDLYVLTCGKNDPRQIYASGTHGSRRHFINGCCESFAQKGRKVYLTIYPGDGAPKWNGQQDDPLMHSKLYLCAKGKPLNGDLKGFPDQHEIYSAWFGSMNFTDRGLGLNGVEQSFELLARANDCVAKKALAERFSYYWRRGGSKRWNTETKTGKLQEVKKGSFDSTKT